MISPIQFQKSRRSSAYRLLSVFVAITFVFSSVVPARLSYAQAVPGLLNLPAPGTMVSLTPGYVPSLIKGITVDPQNPLHFHFIVDTGHSKLKGEALRDESEKLIKYFLASLTVPDEELWVNLSPYEENRIIPDAFGMTEMGRDLLSQDYMLKQLAASLAYPEGDPGREFWKRVHGKVYEKYGKVDLPMNTFNKIWIVPDEAFIFENGATAYLVESKLKVMLEEDYLALRKHIEAEPNVARSDSASELSGIQSEIIKEVLLPEIEREVNEGSTFASLRQMSGAMILSSWYKQNLKETLLGQIYVDKNKTGGIDVNDPQVREKIYNQYVKAFKKGVYDYIKEEYDPVSEDVIPRKYFSGGYKHSPEFQKGADFAMLPPELQNRMGEIMRSSRQVDVDMALLEDPSEQAMAAVEDFYARQKADEAMIGFSTVRRVAIFLTIAAVLGIVTDVATAKQRGEWITFQTLLDSQGFLAALKYFAETMDDIVLSQKLLQRIDEIEKQLDAMNQQAAENRKKDLKDLFDLFLQSPSAAKKDLFIFLEMVKVALGSQDEETYTSYMNSLKLAVGLPDAENYTHFMNMLNDTVNLDMDQLKKWAAQTQKDKLKKSAAQTGGIFDDEVNKLIFDNAVTKRDGKPAQWPTTGFFQSLNDGSLIARIRDQNGMATLLLQALQEKMAANDSLGTAQLGKAVSLVFLRQIELLLGQNGNPQLLRHAFNYGNTNDILDPSRNHDATASLVLGLLQYYKLTGQESAIHFAKSALGVIDKYRNADGSYDNPDAPGQSGAIVDALITQAKLMLLQMDDVQRLGKLGQKEILTIAERDVFLKHVKATADLFTRPVESGGLWVAPDTINGMPGHFAVGLEGGVATGDSTAQARRKSMETQIEAALFLYLAQKYYTQIDLKKFSVLDYLFYHARKMDAKFTHSGGQGLIDVIGLLSPPYGITMNMDIMARIYTLAALYKYRMPFDPLKNALRFVDLDTLNHYGHVPFIRTNGDTAFFSEGAVELLVQQGIPREEIYFLHSKLSAKFWLLFARLRFIPAFFNQEELVPDVTGVKGKSPAPQLLKDFRLAVPFPNPAYSKIPSMIEFELKNRATVTVRVLNVLGQEVAVVLNNEQRVAGKHLVPLVTKDLPAGIYFLQMEARQNGKEVQRATQKFTVLDHAMTAAEAMMFRLQFMIWMSQLIVGGTALVLTPKVLFSQSQGLADWFYSGDNVQRFTPQQGGVELWEFERKSGGWYGWGTRFDIETDVRRDLTGRNMTTDTNLELFEVELPLNILEGEFDVIFEDAVWIKKIGDNQVGQEIVIPSRELLPLGRIREGKFVVSLDKIYDRRGFTVVQGGYKGYSVPRNVPNNFDFSRMHQLKFSPTSSQGRAIIGKPVIKKKTADKAMIQEIRTEQADAAKVAESRAPDKLGGIDLNPALLNLKIKRDGNGIPLPVSQQPMQTLEIDGFIPVIINIQPITNVPVLLGIADQLPEDPSDTAGKDRGADDLAFVIEKKQLWLRLEEENRFV